MRHRTRPVLERVVRSQRIILCLAVALVTILTNNSAAQTCSPCAQLLAPGVGYLVQGVRLYWTTDNGSHWDERALPKIKEEGVLSVYFLNASTGWVLLGEGDDPEPILDLASTNDSGASWSVTHIDLPVDPREPVMPQGDINFTDAKHGWMNLSVESGSAFHLGELFRTVDGGKKWIRVGAPGTEGDVRFIDQRSGWVLCGASGELWATHDGGVNWSPVSVEVPAALAGSLVGNYSMPLFSNKRTALLVDFSLASNDPEADKRGTDIALYTTTNAGKSWKFAGVIAHFSFPNPPVSADVANSTLITAQRIGNKLTIQHIPLDDPDEVSVTNSDLGFAGGIRSLTFATAQQGWLLAYSATCPYGASSGCSQEQVLATVDGGATWNNIMPGPHLPPTPPPSTSKPIPLVWQCCINPCKDAQTKRPVDCRTGKPLE